LTLAAGARSYGSWYLGRGQDPVAADTIQQEMDMVAVLDIQMDVELYKAQQLEVAAAQAKLDEVKARIKDYLEEQELTSLEVGDYMVKVTQINRETIETKIAKVLIPKKYLDQVLKTSSYSQLRIDRKKEA